MLHFPHTSGTVLFSGQAARPVFSFTPNSKKARYSMRQFKDMHIIGIDHGYDNLKTVNGISADYGADGYYWALYIGGEYAATGVDTTPISDGGEYALVREAA